MAAPPSRTPTRFQILVCDGPSCGVTCESDLLKAHLLRLIAGDDDLKARVHVVDYTCFGRCDDGPNLFVRALGPADDPGREPDPDALTRERGFYPGMDEGKCGRVLADHCGRGEIVDALVDDY